MKGILSNPQPSGSEFVFMIFVVTVSILVITLVDITVHDGYVRPIVAECYEKNTSEFCEQRRIELSVIDPANQLGLTKNYGDIILVIMLTFAFFAFIFRVVMGRLAGAEIDPLLFFVGILWGFSVISLFFFGWADALYYSLRGLEIPETLNWLNNTGLFQYIKQFGDDPVNVDKRDLFTLMALGVVVLLFFWIIITHHFRKGSLRHLGLIN